MPTMEVNEEFLEHYGVLGMKWGIRRNRSAARAARKDQASLKKAGYTKEAAAVGKVAAKSEAKAAAGESKLAAKRAAKKAKEEQAAADRREDTKVFLKQQEKYMKKAGFSADRIKREMDWMNKFYESELNATPASMRKERRKAIAAVAGALVLAGAWTAAEMKYG